MKSVVEISSRSCVCGSARIRSLQDQVRRNDLCQFLVRRSWPIILAVLLASNLSAAENKVLELDGFGSYVELPPNIFTNVTEGKLVGNARAVTADSPVDVSVAVSEPLKATQQLPPPALPATGPANVLANNQNAAMWCIVGALTLIVALLT